MNLEDMLRSEARASAPNPLASRTGELIAGVRRRRRARAAGATMASVATVATIGVIVWQVSGTQRDPVPPAQPVEVCTQTIDDLLPDGVPSVIASVSIAGAAQGPSAVVTTLFENPDDGDLEVPVDSIASYAVDPVTGAIRGYHLAGTSTETVLVPAGNPAEWSAAFDFSACEGDSLADGDYELYQRGSVTDAGAWATDPVEFSVADGVVEATAAPTEEPTEEPSGEPTQDPTDPESEEPSTPVDTLDPAPEFEPMCGDAWAPPSPNTGLELTVEWPEGPFVSGPNSGGSPIAVEPTVRNVSSEQIAHGVYTWTVLVRDGVVVAPEYLGSDDTRDLDLAPDESLGLNAGHSLGDVCAPGWTPSVPLEPLTPGRYEAYVMLMDLDLYQSEGTRNVLAIAPAGTIDVTN
ncbi:hypothetical protein EXU48_21355 [Occultella glacieicola]|uniref:Uncharacterized protein n=1 Tax=Occultella glacieicola TaxID=2518684 RepID=A0ABY2DZ66_9MICO|nr:hypothetical protein [Occultella glacieicola]TDE89269.1 hypothetical protein EXU48_21355 [Occultella glacieicola]